MEGIENKVKGLIAVNKQNLLKVFHEGLEQRLKKFCSSLSSVTAGMFSANETLSLACKYKKTKLMYVSNLARSL